MSDRDPLQQLADFGTGGPVNPLPASEVRRLGDRRRARRTAVSAVAGVTAVLAVAVPASLYAARDGGGPLPPTNPSPSRGATSIPDDFPLDRDAYEFGSDGARRGPAADVDVLRARPCDVAPLASSPATDHLGFVNEGPEFVDSRELLLFDDEATARTVLEETRSAVAACTDDVREGIPLTWRTEQADTGHDSVTFVQGVPAEMGGVTYQYTRVGAAILTVQWTSEGGGDVAEQTAITKAITPEMCVFTVAGCTSGDPSPTEVPTVPEIAADFPLAEGFPETSERGKDGYSGPNRTLEPISIEVCGTPLPERVHRDRLLARYESAEDYRTRQLTTYADAETAVAASRAMIAAFQECPTDGPDSEGYVAEREVRKLALGGESWAVLDRSTLQGGETPFGGTLLVVRVGRAVLLEEQTGHAGYPNEEGVQELSQRLTTPIAAMCAFTVAGCGTGTSESPVTETPTGEDDATADGGFGPSLGGLRLGEGLAQVESAGWTLAGDGDCIGLLAPGGGDAEQGMYQEGVGVASIVDTMDEGTPEGVKAGSSKAAVLEAYPTATFTGGGGAELAVVRLDGPGRWELGLAGDKVVTVALAHDDGTCTA